MQGIATPAPSPAGLPEKEIFGPYWDGSRQRFIDPLTVRRRYQHATNGQFDRLLGELRSTEPDAKFRAVEALLQSTVYAFELAPFDPATGHGSSEKDTMALLRRFTAWCEDVKKKRGPSPTSVASTISGPAGSPVATKNSSGCGCKSPGLQTALRKPCGGA